ncbi:MAG TPA: hypothetical protein VF799_02375 [Geobacteraceae bacterium]
MSVVIVDAREWQRQFDLHSGAAVNRDDALTRAVRDVLKRHPYPGDMEPAANRWVTDTALDLLAAHEPRLVCLSYASQYFAQRFKPSCETERLVMIREVFAEALRFIEQSGFVPVIVGTGDMTELQGEMDLSMLDAVVSTGGGSARYTGLSAPSKKDLAYVASLPGVERLVERDEWIRLFQDTQCEPHQLPDYLLVCREGWGVRTVGSSLRRSVRVHANSFTVPVSTPLGSVRSITDIRGLIEAELQRNPVVLIVVEGVGERDFPLPFTSCANGIEWYCYETGEGQYLSLATGTHQVFAYPPGHHFTEEATASREFPFSGIFREVPEHTLGADFEGRSIAVGNRSMFTHMVFGADLSIECFARNLYNQGCIAVIREGCE